MVFVIWYSPLKTFVIKQPRRHSISFSIKNQRPGATTRKSGMSLEGNWQLFWELK